MKNQISLIGKSLTHSYSQQLFSDFFLHYDICCKYTLLEIESIILLQNLLTNYPNLCGFNVTIPYKKTILPLMNTLDTSAQTIQAINTVLISSDGLWHGYNTDAYGFKTALIELNWWQPLPALILGTGGAAQAAYHALLEIIPDKDIFFVSRTPKLKNQISFHSLDAHSLQFFRLIINATPLGMFPASHLCPQIPYSFLTPKHRLFDMVYNPSETLFMQNGKYYGASVSNGLGMLIHQASQAWRIWNGYWLFANVNFDGSISQFTV